MCDQNNLNDQSATNLKPKELKRTNILQTSNLKYLLCNLVKYFLFNFQSV